jgi:hypothetical protein
MMKEAAEMIANRRQEARRPVQMRAYAVPPSGMAAQALVSDLTYDGCCVECTPMPKRGTRLELRVVRLGAIEAEVRWSRGGRAGLSFLAA